MACTDTLTRVPAGISESYYMYACELADLPRELTTGPRNNTVNGDTFRTRGISERRERHVRGAVNGAERPFRNFLAFCFVHWRNK